MVPPPLLCPLVEISPELTQSGLPGIWLWLLNLRHKPMRVSLARLELSELLQCTLAVVLWKAHPALFRNWWRKLAGQRNSLAFYAFQSVWGSNLGPVLITVIAKWPVRNCSPTGGDLISCTSFAVHILRQSVRNKWRFKRMKALLRKSRDARTTRNGYLFIYKRDEFLKLTSPDRKWRAFSTSSPSLSHNRRRNLFDGLFLSSCRAPGRWRTETSGAAWNAERRSAEAHTVQRAPPEREHRQEHGFGGRPLRSWPLFSSTVIKI